jgi:hypothetical protein
MPEYLLRLQNAPAASFHVLDEAKAKRMNAKTLYIPSAPDVATAIRNIDFGNTQTILELRRVLALAHGADTACPACTIKYWKWLAWANTEITPEEWIVPWWRVLKDGKPSRHMPGGVAHQLELLQQEQA